MKEYIAGRLWIWITVLITLTVIGVGGWYLYTARQPTSYTPQSQSHTPAEPAKPKPHPEEKQKPTSYTSRHGIVLKVDESPENAPLSSPYRLTGQVPGNWSFEASFPVEIIDSNGTSLAKSPAHLQGDWMTTAYVPFTVMLNFVQTSSVQDAQLILRKDNPSGMAENDDDVTIPIKLAAQK